MSVYFFRPVQDGTCVECGKPYHKLVGYVHLTADGVKHPRCDKDAPVTVDMVKNNRLVDAVVDTVVWDDAIPLPPPPKPRPVTQKPAPKKKPPPAKKKAPKKEKKVGLKVVPTAPRPDVERTGGKVCRKCWTVHPPSAGCGR